MSIRNMRAIAQGFLSLIVILSLVLPTSQIKASSSDLATETSVPSNIGTELSSSKLNRLYLEHPKAVFGERPNLSENTLQADEPLLICTHSTCSNIPPSELITLVWEGPGDTTDPTRWFRITCSTWGCTQKDIYYQIVYTVEWSTGWYGTCTASALLTMPYKGTATGEVSNAPCGEGYSGEGTIVASGVFPKEFIYPDPNRSSHFFMHAKGGTGQAWQPNYGYWFMQVTFDPNLLSTDASAFCNDVCNPESATKGREGDPINTDTGTFVYPVEGLSFSTTPELNFNYTYVSEFKDKYVNPLGHGWTHNHDIKLIFPNQADGLSGFVLFKHPSGNLYRFFDSGYGRYEPYGGLTSILEKNSGSPITYTVTDQNQNTYLFDEDGKLLTYTTSAGKEVTYSYDTNDLLLQVSLDNETRYLDFEYDVDDRLISVTDHAAREISFIYDSSDDLITATDVLGGEWTYEYDTDHLMLEVIDPDEVTKVRNVYSGGKVIQQFNGEDELVVALTYTTDENGNVVTLIEDALENEKIHAYDDRETLITQTNALESEVEKTYDNNFRPTVILDENGDETALTWSDDGANLTQIIDAEGGQTDITYDALNNPTSVIDPMEYLTTYEYDGTLLTSVTNALDQETTYTYTTEGYLETVTDPLGNTVSYTYDSYGQRTSMTDALENIWEYSYDTLGRLIDVTDPLERVTHHEYDDAGNLTRSVQNYDIGKSQNEDNVWNIVTEYTYDVRGNQTSVTDTFGNTTYYEYDAADRLIKITDPDTNETIYTYNEAGQLISTADALGNETTYTYDEAGRLTVTTDALNNTTTTTYNADGTVASTTDGLGRITSYTYDDLKRVLTVTQPNGAVTTNTYDANGNLTLSKDALNNETEYEYDALGRLIKTTDELGNFTENFYDDAGRLIQSIDARGNATIYEYDDAGRQISVTDALENQTQYEYDNLGRRTAVIDAAGNRTEYTYDELNRVIAVTDPLNNTITTEYDALGQVIRRTDANGNDVTFTYNNLGQTTSQTDALEYTTSFTYDAVGNRLSATDARGSVTSMVYDELNRPVVTIDPLSNSTTTTYDAVGQVITSTNANGETTTFSYNSVGGQESITDALNNVTEYDYDLLGRVTRFVDANGIVTAYEYDELSRLTAVIENYQAAVTPDHETNVRTEYTYDENGNRLTITDGNGHVTTFTYDELNRLLTETDALSNTWSYTYDEIGNRISMTDANGDTTAYAYDDRNQLTAIDYVDSSDVSFVYDAGGRRTSMTDSVGTTTWVYDAMNRPTEITDPFSSTIINVYDEVGNRTRMVYPGMDVGYTYNAANQLVNVYDWTKNTSYEYDPTGRLQKIKRPNGVDSTYTYDAAGRLTQLMNATIESELSSFQYSYDNVGNRTQAVERFQTSGAGPTIRLTVVDNAGALQFGKEVTVFDGETETSYQTVTDVNGQAVFTLPNGSYRFRIDIDGVLFWTGTENHCTIGECRDLIKIVPIPVRVDVWDGENFIAEQEVYAYQNGQYTGYHGTTDLDGGVMIRLPEGEYTFKTEHNSNEYWSEACLVPGCWGTTINVNPSVTVTVLDNLSMPQEGVEVVAFDDETETEYSGFTDANGQVQLNVPDASFRFRAEFNSAYYWSDVENHCTVPVCLSATVNVILPVVVTVLDVTETPQEGLTVYAYDDTTDTGLYAVTDANGRAFIANLPAGEYRFKTIYDESEYWSDVENHCTIPECTGTTITVGSVSYLPNHISQNSSRNPFSTSKTLIRQPRPVLDPPNDVTITVLNTNNDPQEGLTVYAFDGETYTGFSDVTDSNGEVLLTLPDGNYRFSTDLNGTVFWSDSVNHCEIPNCTTANITVTIPMTVTVTNTDEVLQEGLEVQVFDGETFTGFSNITDENGEVTFTLPVGNYRFRTSLNGTHFWSDEENHCAIPSCEQAQVTVTIPVTVTVKDTDSAPKEGVEVFAFDGETFTGYQGITDENGEVNLTLPIGMYRFRADLGGTQFWSDEVNHCEVPSCEEVENLITVTKPVLVTVLDENEDPYSGFEVYAFDGFAPTGHHAVTDENGQASLVLPIGEYRFGADIRGTLFFSDEENHCEVSGCESVTIDIPGGYEYEETTINYTYDSLNRLTDANYSNGDWYEYSYDAVGNRLHTAQSVDEVLADFDYVYDDANRLIEMEEIEYTWDDNGNLLDDGVNEYTYDSANRLIEVSNQLSVNTYQYNGLGDRLTQTMNEQTTNYTLDLASGLTQVLYDGENFYTYGIGRISQLELYGNTPEYFITDALGSVRQLTHESSAVLMAQSYDPYGNVVSSAGSVDSIYGYTGEQTDTTGNVYLRARYYNPTDGRFISRDTWSGDVNSPLSLNRWNYVNGNPINLTDPTGNTPERDGCGWDPGNNVPYVETFAKISKWDWLNTYAMAGVAVQCWIEFYPNNDEYDGEGPGQITNKEKNTPYGDRIPDPNYPDNKKKNRGYGILCYIVTKYDEKLMESVTCTVCQTKEEMDKIFGSGNYRQEEPHDQSEKKWAVEYMRRRIKLVTDTCIAAGCSSTDVYIAAALAQNGPGFTKFNLDDWLTVKKNRINNDGITLDWYQWFTTNTCVNTSQQLNRFEDATDALKTWYIPRDVNFNTIHELQKMKICVH